VYKKQVWESLGHPAEPLSPGSDPKLDISVVVTNIRGALRTLQAAAGLARGLGARLTVLLAEVVPYPLPLNAPPVSVEFTERTLLRMLPEPEIETNIQVCLCRDRWQTIRATLKPDSLVVIGGQKRWWPTEEQRLATRLQREGHHVLLVEPRSTR
jgi:hypothetical protein